MKIVVFGDDRRVGALEGDRIIDLNKANAALPSRLDLFIAAGAKAIEAAERAIAKADKAAVVDAGSVKLHAPWAGKRLAMAGGNFADHLAGMNANLHGIPVTGDSLKAAYDQARSRGHWGFWKVLDEVAGDDDDIPYPANKTQYFDYEGEVAIVIGKRGKDIPAANIRDHVWGVTLSNDWSCRDGMDQPKIVQYNMVKNFDRALSIGPCIAVGEEAFDNIDLETRVNGQPRQSFNSKDMIFTFGEVLEYLSCEFTFVPGDVICGGTAAGTAADKTKRVAGQAPSKELFLKLGDIVEVSSPQIGRLRNKIV
ncbi:MAG: fumarylacetoacetate hydrolase family protein [Betaproteobacteria bacterium]|nr:fumarylacetoacetate hydrolase family protein [Betaproteobacteria bacterium]